MGCDVGSQYAPDAYLEDVIPAASSYMVFNEDTVPSMAYYFGACKRRCRYGRVHEIMERLV